MVRRAFAVVAVMCMACGGSDDGATTPDDPSARSAEQTPNGAPVISLVEIAPADPTANTELSVIIRAQDPDRDAIDFEIEWYRNGQMLSEDNQRVLGPDSFNRGDILQVVVRASDGRHDVVARSRPTAITNAVPAIRSIALTPVKAVATDVLTAHVQYGDEDGDDVEVHYRWSVDGQVLEREKGDRLAPGTATRDQKVLLEARLSDGQSESEWRAAPPLRMGNASPEITTQPNYTMAGPSLYKYQVVAKDPDGDTPLRYELNESPPGMKVDFVSGEVVWAVPSDANGVFPIELSVSDSRGARTLQRYSLEVRWEATPAAGR